MKIYKFYCKGSVLNNCNSNKYQLYAITCKKSLAKEFKSTRNMKDCFKMVVEEYPDDSEWNTLKHEFQLQVLQKHPFIGFKDKTKPTSSIVEFVVTMEEKISIEDATDSFLPLFTNNLVNPMIFDKDVRKSLHKLKYMEFYRVLSSAAPIDDGIHGLEMIDKEYPGEEYDYPSVDIDEVELFIDIYKDTLELGK